MMTIVLAGEPWLLRGSRARDGPGQPYKPPPQHERRPEDVGGSAADVADKAANNARLEETMAATVARFSLKSAANAAFIAWALTQSMAFHFEQARKTEAAAGAQKADGTEDDAMDDRQCRHQRG